MTDRRNEPRNLCSDIVELAWEDRLGRHHTTKGVLEDISTEGSCVQTEIAVPIETMISLRLENARYTATVRYCTLISGGYFVGLGFEGLGWTPQMSGPRHLLMAPIGGGESARLER